MKKRILLLVAVVMAAVVSAYAQPRSIGGRLAYGFEFSYQHSLASDRMITLDLGFPGFQPNIEAAVTHDWIDPFGASVPWNERGEWHWFLGVGGGVNWAWGQSYRDNFGTQNAGGIAIGVAGRVGIEYDFWFPMQLAIDWRPMFGPAIAYWNGTGMYSNSATNVGFNTYGLYASAICLAIRYNF